MGIRHYANSVDPRYLEFVLAEPRRMWNLPPTMDSACINMAWAMGWEEKEDPLQSLPRLPLVSFDKAWRELNRALNPERPAHQLVHVPNNGWRYLYEEGHFSVLKPSQLRDAYRDLVTVTDDELLVGGVLPDRLDYVRFNIEDCLPQFKAIVDAEWGLITAFY